MTWYLPLAAARDVLPRQIELVPADFDIDDVVPHDISETPTDPTVEAAAEELFATIDTLQSQLGVDADATMRDNYDVAQEAMLRAEVVIIHDRCPDGTASLITYLQARESYNPGGAMPYILLGNRNTLPTRGQLMRICRGKSVLMLDFVFDAHLHNFLHTLASETWQQGGSRRAFFSVIDHHESALPVIAGMNSKPNAWCVFKPTGNTPGVPSQGITSAVLLVWYTFFGSRELPPLLLDFVAGDTFAFAKHPQSNLIRDAFQARSVYNPRACYEAMRVDRNVLIREGEQFGVFARSIIRANIAQAVRCQIQLPDGTVVGNIRALDTSFMQSETGAAMIEEYKCDVAICWRSVVATSGVSTIAVSIRTRAGAPFSARVIATAFDGGGSEAAAGCVAERVVGATESNLTTYVITPYIPPRPATASAATSVISTTTSPAANAAVLLNALSVGVVVADQKQQIV